MHAMLLRPFGETMQNHRPLAQTIWTLGWLMASALLSGCGYDGSPALRSAVNSGSPEEVIQALRSMSVAVGVDEDGQITAIDAAGQRQYVEQQFTDSDCRQLQRLAEAGHLDRLESLDFIFAPISDEGCRSLATLEMFVP